MQQHPINFRKASIQDLEDILKLLHDDELGNLRENPSDPYLYSVAFDKILSDPNNEIIVCELDKKIISVLQLTYIQHLTFQGAKVAHIEGVRIHRLYRRQGIGKKMFEWAIRRAKNLGCHRIQLMTDKRRVESLKFYQNLGFSATHEGMKLFLGPPN